MTPPKIHRRHFLTTYTAWVLPLPFDLIVLPAILLAVIPSREILKNAA